MAAPPHQGSSWVVPPPKFVRAASSSAVAACPGRYSPIVGHMAPMIASTKGEDQTYNYGNDLVLQQRAETEAIDGEKARSERDTGRDPPPVVPHVVGCGDVIGTV